MSAEINVIFVEFERKFSKQEQLSFSYFDFKMRLIRLELS